MSNPALWSHDTFAGHFRMSPRKAFEYRLDTLGDPIPEEWLTLEEKEALANGTPTPEATIISEVINENKTPVLLDLTKNKTPVEVIKDPENKPEGYSEADLKEILKKNNIKFFGGAKLEQLAELCIKNNLL